MVGKFYCATSLTNSDQAKIMIRKLSDLGHQVSYDWTLHGRVTEPEKMFEICSNEVSGVLDADVLIVLLPGGRGTHIELGLALGANKPVFFIVPQDFKVEVCFYYHQNIVFFDNLDKAVEVIHKQLSELESVFSEHE